MERGRRVEGTWRERERERERERRPMASGNKQKVRQTVQVHPSTSSASSAFSSCIPTLLCPGPLPMVVGLTSGYHAAFSAPANAARLRLRVRQPLTLWDMR